MLVRTAFVRGFAVLALTATLAVPSRADELRNVKKGEPVPAYRLPAVDGTVVESEALKGSVVVIVCLSAEQRRSELAAMESYTAWQKLDSEQVRLIHVTADVIQKSYFESFRQERGIDAPLAFDADRSFYGKLGLIVLPTTIVIDAEGKLAQVISLHSDRYEHTLDAYMRHTIGQIDDGELQERLAVGASGNGSPKSLASAHRALARSMREKGLLDTARAELVKAREQEPDNHEILLDMADLDCAMGDLDSADELVDIVLQSQPNHRRAQQLKGIGYFRRGQFDEAERLLTEALKLNPNPEQIHYYLGQICEHRGDTQQALEHYREALRRLLQEPE